MQHIYKQTDKAQMLLIKMFGIKEHPTRKKSSKSSSEFPKKQFLYDLY